MEHRHAGHLSRSSGNDLVDIHIGLCAAASLVYYERELVVKLTVKYLITDNHYV